MEGAADLAMWMPAVQRYMDASGAIPQLTVSLGHLPPLGSLLACSSSFSFSCSDAGNRSPSARAPGSSDSPDEARSSSACSTGHSRRAPHCEACQHSRSQQVCADVSVSFALHTAVSSSRLTSKPINHCLFTLGPPELCRSEADATMDLGPCGAGAQCFVGFRPQSLEVYVVVNILRAEGKAVHHTNKDMDAGVILAVHLQTSSSITCASAAEALQRARQLLALLPSNNAISAPQVGGVCCMRGCCQLLGSLLLCTSRTLPSSHCSLLDFLLQTLWRPAGSARH